MWWALAVRRWRVFLATHMFSRNAQAWGAIVPAAWPGYETGAVHRWRPASGFEEVPGTGCAHGQRYRHRPR